LGSPSSLTVGSCNDPRPGRLGLPPRHHPTPLIDGSAAVELAPSTPPPGPHPLGLPLTALGQLATQPPHCPARHGCRLAPPRLSPLLALEVPTPLTGPAADRPRDPHLDSTYGSRKPHLAAAALPAWCSRPEDVSAEFWRHGDDSFTVSRRRAVKAQLDRSARAASSIPDSRHVGR
jgi:hypothetical protein